MRFRFIRDHADQYPVDLLCRLLLLTTSGYYAWLVRAPSQRSINDAELTQQIEQLHRDSRGLYGAPRLRAALRRHGVFCSIKRVARLMRGAGLAGRRPHRKRGTTDSKHTLPVAENLLAREFTATKAGQKWVSDITYIQTWEGWLYLAVVLDLYSRRVIGWSMSDQINESLVESSLAMAVSRGSYSSELIFHSDRGSQYAANRIRSRLAELAIRQSMSRKGNCWDNAVSESFFGTLKQELVNRVFASREEARAELFEYIEVFYNRERLHSSIGYRTPAEFESGQQPSINTCPP